MTQDEFESLAQAAELDVLSSWIPRFIVALRVPTKFGVRSQTATITFGSQQAFKAATTDSTIAAIDEVKQRLLRASQTQQGKVAEGVVEVETEQSNATEQTAIKHPAH